MSPPIANRKSSIVNPYRPPITMLAASLVACLALFITSRSPLVPIIALGYIGLYFSDERLPAVSFPTWIIRMLAYAVLAFLNSGKSAGGSDYLFEARSVNTVGELCEFEMVLQCWRFGGGAGRGAISILLSGLVLLCACNTPDERFVQAIAPLYFICILLALRDQRAQNASIPFHRGTALRRVLAMAVALMAGAVVNRGINSERDRIMNWVSRAIGAHQWETRSGISRQPTLDATFDLQDSPNRVLILRGKIGDGHWRAIDFDRYDKGTWGPPNDGRKGTLMGNESLREGASGDHVQVTHLTQDYGLVFTPLHIAGLVPDSGSEIYWHPREGGPLRTKADAPYNYEVITNALIDFQGPLCTPIDAAQRARFLQIPNGQIDPRVIALAHQITARAGNDRARIAAVASYLMTNNKYSLRARMGRGDPVSTFILEHKAAHCEYFASAAVIMLRAVGIPSRYVVGYYAHENAGPDTTVVRQRDAHAWAESWARGAGWVTVDATPGDGRPDVDPPVAAWLRAWEWLQDRWGIVVNFLANLSRAQLLLVVIGLTALWALDRWRQNRRRAKAPQGFRYHETDAALRDLAGRYEKLWRNRGHPVPDDRTWEEHLQIVARGDGPAPQFDYEKARQFLAGYNELRFGGHDAPEKIADLQIVLEKMGDGRK